MFTTRKYDKMSKHKENRSNKLKNSLKNVLSNVFVFDQPKCTNVRVTIYSISTRCSSVLIILLLVPGIHGGTIHTKALNLTEIKIVHTFGHLCNTAQLGPQLVLQRPHLLFTGIHLHKLLQHCCPLVRRKDTPQEGAKDSQNVLNILKL